LAAGQRERFIIGTMRKNTGSQLKNKPLYQRKGDISGSEAIDRANGQATVVFDGVDLDNCIKQGLELTGYARCPNCKQTYTFQIRLNLQEKLHRYVDTVINGETVTALAADAYDVSIEFSKRRDLPNIPILLDEPEVPGVKAKCIPCSGCTPNCERLKKR
jgi:hypothetical protein